MGFGLRVEGIASREHPRGTRRWCKPQPASMLAMPASHSASTIHDADDQDALTKAGVTRAREVRVQVELLHGGVHAGWIRGRLVLQEAHAMTVSAVRKQHLATQRFEPAHLCGFVRPPPCPPATLCTSA